MSTKNDERAGDACRIRQVEARDLDRCYRIETESYEGDEAATRDKIRIRIETFPQAFLVAEMDGEVAGFDREPLACASIGQVHRARLHSGELVAVKLLRNRIELVVREDIRLLGWVLSLLQPLFSEYTRNSIEAVLAAFRHTILQEVDMRVELSNLERFRQTYAASQVRLPVPWPDFSVAELARVVDGFRHRHRRFGAIEPAPASSRS